MDVFVGVKPTAPDKAPASNSSSINQLLGIKGAAQETVSHKWWSHNTILDLLLLFVLKKFSVFQ